MGISIIAVHLAGGAEHEHIAEVEWRNLEWGNTGESTCDDLAEWLEQEENLAVVAGTAARVDVVRSPTGSMWLQAVEGGRWTDRLLALPRY